MNILLIDEEFPFPLNSGKKIRTFNLTRELARSASITYLAYAPDDLGTSDLKNLGVECIPVPLPDRRQQGLLFYLRLLRNLLSRYPYIVTSHFTTRFQTALEDVVRRKKIDIIICEWTPYAMFIKNIDSCKSIIVAHNIESNIWRRYEVNERNWLRRWYISIQRKKVENFERVCFSWVQGATSVSEKERIEIQSFKNSLPVEVVDNGVDTEYFTPSAIKSKEQTLVFSGSMDWRPNQDAVLFFAGKIFPRLQTQFGNIRFIIVGRTPSESIQRLQEIEGITVTGTVDDVRPYIAEASLVVVPLRIGGGTRLKILEAMAMEKTVLSTTIGAEGLEVEPGKHILIADSDDEWYSAIKSCFFDTQVAQRIAIEGRRLVEQRYTWRKIGEKYVRFLEKVARV